jgi:hypothetical protein
MAIKIKLGNSINPSLQVGDNAYVSEVTNSVIADTPELIGEIIDVGMDYISVNDNAAWTFDTTKTWFLLFAKPISINESSLKGYYADVTFKNESKKYAELFAISSEIALSSK